MHLLIWLLLLLTVLLRFITTRPVYVTGQKVRITATLSSQPQRFESYQKLSLLGLTLYIPLYPEINYGDRVTVEGVVSDKVLKNVTVIKVEKSQGVLGSLRGKIVDFYQEGLPEPHASLVSGITVGAKTSLPSNFWQSLTKTGTTHVVVASGMNVTLVASFLMAILTVFLPRRKAIPLAVAGIWGYTIVSGLEAPLVRAGVMGSLAFSAQELGRISHAWRILVFSALIMLVIKPEWLVDLGFILSFVATTSLMLFEKKIRNLFGFLPEILKEGFSTSLAAQIGVAPILIVSFGYFNALSPVINALVLWSVPLIMIIGLVSGIVGLVFAPVGALILLLAYPLTSWFIWIVNVLD